MAQKQSAERPHARFPTCHISIGEKAPLTGKPASSLPVPACPAALPHHPQLELIRGTLWKTSTQPATPSFAPFLHRMWSEVVAALRTRFHKIHTENICYGTLSNLLYIFVGKSNRAPCHSAGHKYCLLPDGAKSSPRRLWAVEPGRAGRGLRAEYLGCSNEQSWKSSSCLFQMAADIISRMSVHVP